MLSRASRDVFTMRSIFRRYRDISQTFADEQTGQTAFGISQDAVRWIAYVQRLKDLVLHSYFFPAKAPGFPCLCQKPSSAR